MLAVGSLLVAVLLRQLGLSVYVSIDARRRELENPGQYAAGVPFIGLVVFGVYHSYRDEFARPLESEQAAEPDRKIESGSEPSAGPTEAPPADHWTTRTPGLAGVPRRFAYSVAGLGRLFWAAIVVVPTVLLVTVAVHNRVAIAYSGACAGLWLMLLAVLAQFTNTTVRIEADTGAVLLTYNYGDHVLASDPREERIDLDEVPAVVLTPVDGWTVARVRYESPLTVQSRVFPVPGDRPAMFSEALEQYGIAVETRSVWMQIGAATLSIGAIPTVAAVIWPEFVFSGPVLVCLVGLLVWIATAPLEA